MVSLCHLQHMEELRLFLPKAGFLTFRYTNAYPRFQTPASISLWLALSSSEMLIFFLTVSWQKDRVSSCCVFTFHFPDKTVSLQRKSNLIFNIFSMKAIKSINSLQKEQNAVGYSKEESPWKLFSWDSVLSRLRAWLSEERKAKRREETSCPFCCH